MVMKWRKILYEKQPFADNYVDDTFLEELRTNANIKQHDFTSMVQSTGVVTQQICAVEIFFSIFLFLQAGTISSTLLGGIDIILAVVCYFILSVCLKLYIPWKDTLATSALFCATLLILSPVLRTLTKSYADDSIWALALFLACVHLLTHDYFWINTGIGRFDGAVSLNAAIFTAVLLGSRLQSNESVFSFILLAIILFAVLPRFHQQVKHASQTFHVLSTIMVISFTIMLTSQISILLCAVSCFLICFLTFICPFWYIHAQEYKNEIHGPWDVMHIQPQL